MSIKIETIQKRICDACNSEISITGKTMGTGILHITGFLSVDIKPKDGIDICVECLIRALRVKD